MGANQDAGSMIGFTEIDADGVPVPAAEGETLLHEKKNWVIILWVLNAFLIALTLLSIYCLVLANEYYQFGEAGTGARPGTWVMAISNLSTPALVAAAMVLARTIIFHITQLTQKRRSTHTRHHGVRE